MTPDPFSNISVCHVTQFSYLYDFIHHRCVHSEKKYGPPVACEDCQLVCAFRKPDEARKKVRLLVYVCRISMEPGARLPSVQCGFYAPWNVCLACSIDHTSKSKGRTCKISSQRSRPLPSTHHCMCAVLVVMVMIPPPPPPWVQVDGKTLCLLCTINYKKAQFLKKTHEQKSSSSKHKDRDKEDE